MYLLVLVRKLLEAEEKQGQYAILNFYCDWTVHARLSHSGVADDIIRRFDAFHHSIFEGTQSVDLAKVSAELGDLISVEHFRAELRLLLVEYSLPDEIVTNDSKWKTFLMHYATAVSSAPLCLRKSKKTVPVHVDSVEMTAAVVDKALVMHWLPNPVQPDANTLVRFEVYLLL